MSNEYQEVLAALERRAPLAEIRPLLVSLKNSSTGINAGIDFVDAFGLTICMRAAAHGRLRVVKAACELGARIARRNPFTRANLLHYAAQQPIGGAEIITWAILEEKAPDTLLEERIFVLGEDRDGDKDKKWDRGNGHTVAFEAVFNNNVAVVNALIALEQQGHAINLTKRAVHGSSPLGWAFKYNNEQIVTLLMSSPQVNPTTQVNQTIIDDAKKREVESTDALVSTADTDWRDRHKDDVQESQALHLADELRKYIDSDGGRSVQGLLKNVDRDFLNEPYGRFGQPLLILVPTDPLIMNNPTPTQDQKSRYTEVVEALIAREADPTIKEKGLMEVSAGFREVFFGYIDALERMLQNVYESERKDFVNKDFVNEVGVFNGYTRLIDARLIRNTEAIELLLDYGINQRIKGFNGWT